MNEILYRGFCPCKDGEIVIFLNNKEIRGDWKYGYYLKATTHWTNHGIHEDWIVGGAVQNGGFLNLMQRWAVIPETIGQYIGIEDKNGLKIFNNDIVKCLSNTKEWNAIVKEDYCNPCFVLQNIINKYDLEYDFIKCFNMELEIIGNIYSNPKL